MVAALLAGGCTSGATSDYVQYARAIRQGIATSFGSGDITKAQAGAIPYASLAYRLGRGPQQILVLATESNDESLWTAPTHVVLTTRAGRVARSVGLPHDIAALAPVGADNLPSPAMALSAGFSSTRTEDFADLGLYGVRLNCTTRAMRRETIRILGTAIATVRVDEHCRAVGRQWNFTDSYWIEPQQGVVWRSTQHIHPQGESIEIQLLRPPGPG